MMSNLLSGYAGNRTAIFGNRMLGEGTGLSASIGRIDQFDATYE